MYIDVEHLEVDDQAGFNTGIKLHKKSMACWKCNKEIDQEILVPIIASPGRCTSEGTEYYEMQFMCLPCLIVYAAMTKADREHLKEHGII